MGSQISTGVISGVRSDQICPYAQNPERGLYLLVNPSGSRLWRLKYRAASAGKLLVLGSYPDTSLHKAGAKRDAARTMLAEGVDPGAERKAEKHVQIDTLRRWRRIGWRPSVRP
jgi:hypothetical protein